MPSGGAAINNAGTNTMPFDWSHGTGGPGNYNFGNSGNVNPTQRGDNPFSFTPPPGVPMRGTQPGQPSIMGQPTAANQNPNAPSMNPGGTTSSPIGPGPGQNPAGENQFGNLATDLRDTYGKGMGSILANFLGSGAGFNSALTQQAIDAQIQAMQHQINVGWGNISSQLGEMGISPNSSVEALSAGDYFSNAIAQENAITAQEYYNMWDSSMNRETGLLESLLGGTQANQANKAGPMDFLSQYFQTTSSLAEMIPWG